MKIELPFEINKTVSGVINSITETNVSITLNNGISFSAAIISGYDISFSKDCKINIFTNGGIEIQKAPEPKSTTGAKTPDKNTFIAQKSINTPDSI